MTTFFIPEGGAWRVKIDAGRPRMAVSGLCPMGPPQSRPSGFVGRGGARERMELSPQAEAE